MDVFSCAVSDSKLPQRNPRTTAILAVAKANGLDIETEIVDTVNPTSEFLKYNPLSKVPVFVGTDGYVLTESIAVAIYRKVLSWSRFSCLALPHHSPISFPECVTVLVT
jgi:hypothetical protein